MEKKTIWHVNYLVRPPVPSFPRPVIVAREFADSTEYCQNGKWRRNETQCVFQYTISGYGIFQDHSGKYHVGPGKGFLCRVRDPDISYYYPPGLKGRWEFVFLAFVGSAAIRMCRQLVRTCGPVFTLDTGNRIISRLMNHGRYSRDIRSVSAAEGGALVMDLLLTLAGNVGEPAEDDSGKMLVRLASEIIRTNMDRDINVTQLARRCGVTREHLSRMFRLHSAQSPYRFIVQQKMNHAACLLRETTMTSRQISSRLGYASAEHFTRTFKRASGFSPMQFRKDGTLSINW